jgi:hypothetical protein
MPQQHDLPLDEYHRAGVEITNAPAAPCVSHRALRRLAAACNGQVVGPCDSS